jgi:hypothetical protein
VPLNGKSLVVFLLRLKANAHGFLPAVNQFIRQSLQAVCLLEPGVRTSRQTHNRSGNGLGVEGIITKHSIPSDV